MPVRVIQQADLWMAEVTPPHGQWRSSRPMGMGYLIEELKSIGLQQGEIDLALREAVEIKSRAHHDDRILPTLNAALAGEYDVPPQLPICEAWLAYALFLGGERLLPLRDVVYIADFIVRGPPTPDEIAWAFLRLRTRGWLDQQDDLYGLTAEGRRAIGDFVGEGTVLGVLRRIEEWIRANPPLGNE